MVIEQKRCSHCKVKYLYQASGDGCHDITNDEKYCHNCKDTINKALNKIPIMREMSFIKCEDFTKKQMQEMVEIDKEAQIIMHEKKKQLALEQGRPFIDLMFTRVFPAMFDWNDGDNKNTTGELRIVDTLYSYSWWSKTDKFELYKIMEIDSQTKENLGNWFD